MILKITKASVDLPHGGQEITCLYSIYINGSARQRWELFHKAIAHTKESNSDALLESEALETNARHSGPLLSSAR